MSLLHKPNVKASRVILEMRTCKLQINVIEPSNQTDQEHNNCKQEVTRHNNSKQYQQQFDYFLIRDREKRLSRPPWRYGFSTYSEIFAYAFRLTLKIQMKKPSYYQDVVARSD